MSLKSKKPDNATEDANGAADSNKRDVKQHKPGSTKWKRELAIVMHDGFQNRPV